MWDIAFSKDPQQKYHLSSPTAQNEKVYIFDRAVARRCSPASATAAASPASSTRVHSIATDSKGNIYTTETYEGKRLQKFVYKGMGPVPRGNQGVPWPKR